MQGVFLVWPSFFSAYGALEFCANNRTEIFTAQIKSRFMLPRGNIKVVCVEEKEYNYLNILFY